MNFEVWQLFLISVLYLGLLFVIASAADNKWLPESLISHPLVYTLSLGVYATSWSYYGSVGLADREGYTFLAVYLGVTIAFLCSPILLKPILRLIREYQLYSLADLLAFRYNSQLAGILVTLFMLTGALPYMALQIQAVTDSIQVLTGDTQSEFLPLGFCLTTTLFAILFGARHVTPREKHEGLVVAIAFESLVKLIALLLVGFYAVFGVFNGLDGFSDWLAQNPQATEHLMRPIHEGPWATMILLSFCAAFLLPRQFHMIFVENIKPQNLNIASWAFPLFLLLLNISIPPILWAGQSLNLGYNADLYVLGISMQSQNALLPVFTFIGGISAASAMIIVTTIALASMCQNHLLLPLSFSKHKKMDMDIYRQLIWGKRVLIVMIILAGYGFYLFLQTHQKLTDLGLISFVAVAQFLPGIVGLLFWRRASQQGFIIGMLAGALLWVMTLILPLFSRAGWLLDSPLEALMIPMNSTTSAFWTLLLNSSLFVFVSILRPQSENEQNAAEACCNNRKTMGGGILYALSLEQVETRLAEITGTEMAQKEVRLAMNDLGFSHLNLDRNELASLRTQIRHNLSGLVGPVLADMMVDEQLQIDKSARFAIADTIRFVEKSLQDSRTEIKEMAGELDALRRFHQKVLHELPLAVVTVSPENQLVSWNRVMSRLSGISESEALGKNLQQIKAPWHNLLLTFVRSDESVKRSVKVKLGNRTSILNLFKSSVSNYTEDENAGYVILIEDHSEIHKLESELAHSERLASIGQLATGVAHEIGNPVTGIACLAQDVQSMPDDRKLQQKSIRDILKLTERISSIVSSLLGYSHNEKNQEDNTETFKLYKLIDESIRLVSLSHRGKKNIFVNQCEKGLKLETYYQKFLQVMVILLSNASEASDDGGKVQIKSEEKQQGVQIEVKDYGLGIEENIIDKIFDPFYTTKQAGEGTGLGLSLAYNIVKNMGGEINVTSQVKQGSKFSVFIPFQQ